MRFFIFILSVFVLTACRQVAAEDVVSASETEASAPFPTVPKLIQIHAFTKEKATGWGPFNGLHEQMLALQEVYTSEALALKLEELETSCRDFESAPFPVIFDKPSVRSRAKVVRTFVQKTQADLIYREDFAPDLIKVVQAYNALLRQLNRIAQEESPDDIPF